MTPRVGGRTLRRGPSRPVPEPFTEERRMSTTTSLADIARRDLPGLEGGLVGPADPGYDEARAVHNGMIDRRPAVIVRCSRPEDVARTIAFAPHPNPPPAARGGGHQGRGPG